MNILKHKLEKMETYIFPPDEANLRYCLGNITFATTKDDLPTEWIYCSVSFSKSVIKMVFDDDIAVVCENFIHNLKDLLTSGIFAMQFRKNEGNLSAKMYITLPLPRFNKQIGNAIQTAFSKLFNIQIPNFNDETDIEGPITIRELYRRSASYRNNNFTIPKIYVQHRFLIPRLRRYQEDAVRWMIQREIKSEARETLHPLYEELQSENGVSIYFNKHTGHVQAERPVVAHLQTGGILADEMGLGKTVEVLACILCHPKLEEVEVGIRSIEDFLPIKPLIHTQSSKPKPDDIQTNSTVIPQALTVECICGQQGGQGIVSCVGCTKRQHKSCFNYEDAFSNYRCPQCWMKMDYLESKGTLIVTPVTLYNQWRREISKHLKSLKVFLYEGCKTKAPVYPTKLKDYDIVLTTYKVLKEELPYVEDQIDRKAVTLRTQSRYSGMRCPLAMIKWWRICLDEAQEVEMPKHKISVMAKKLKAHHRWAVTGTPVSREISSLYGLIDYLQLEPYNEENTWNTALYRPFQSGNPGPMIQFLAEVLWRSFKEDVIDQMKIPPQTITTYPISFSRIERYYYEREHEVCQKKFLKEIKGYNCNQLLKTLEKRCYESLMAPLLSVRKACSHPTATKGGYLANRNRVTSMESFIGEIIRKNDSDINSTLKNLTALLNELGDMYSFQEKPEEAMEAYSKIIELADSFKINNCEISLRVDTEHVIHAFHNVNKVLQQLPSVESSLRNTNVEQHCLSLKTKYMGQDLHRSSVSFQDVEAASNFVSELQTKYTSNHEPWYISLLEWIASNGPMGELQIHIQKSWNNSGNPTHNISNKEKLTDLLATWEDTIKSVRATLKLHLQEIFSTYSDDNPLFPDSLLEGATNCHLNSDKRRMTIEKCRLCNINDAIERYDSLLYYLQFKGSEKPSSQELALRALVSLAKTKKAPQELIDDGEQHIRILNSMKEELREMKRIRNNMERGIRIQYDISVICEKKLSSSDSNILTNLVTQNEKTLRSKLQRRDFLERCTKENSCSKCKCTLGDQHSILSCCHRYCLVCIQSMLDEADNKNVQCYDCGESHNSQGVSYIETREAMTDSNTTTIRGYHSTKIEAITRLILDLKQKDDDVKILVFSTWKDILKRLEEALKLNDVAAKVAPQNLVATLEKFKSFGGETALLLPIELGSRGLNLIEATHVILVEPLLNPANELQAIGRIHRIGQERPTFVHKFVMKRTIEETLYQATSSSADSWDNNKVSLQQLKDLFSSREEELPLVFDSVDNSQSIRDRNTFDDKSSQLKIENPSTSSALNQFSLDEADDIKPAILIKSEIITEICSSFQEDTDISIVESTKTTIYVEDDDRPLTPPSSIKVEPMPSTSGSSTISRKRHRSVSHDDKILSKLQILEEDHGAFGIYVTKELQKLSPENANYLKKLINDAIFEVTKGTMSRDFKIVP